MEEWRDIPGYEGLYQASNTSKVRSLGFCEKHPGRTLKLTITQKGYLRVSLSKNKQEKFYLVHCLVWSAFKGPVPKGMQINHIDENKQNNNLDNLCLMTPKENCNWGTRTERIREQTTNHKSTSKWVIKLTKNDEILHFYPSAHQAEKETGVSFKNISACCLGKRISAGGYKWKYAE